MRDDKNKTAEIEEKCMNILLDSDIAFMANEISEYSTDLSTWSSIAGRLNKRAAVSSSCNTTYRSQIEILEDMLRVFRRDSVLFAHYKWAIEQTLNATLSRPYHMRFMSDITAKKPDNECVSSSFPQVLPILDARTFALLDASDFSVLIDELELQCVSLLENDNKVPKKEYRIGNNAWRKFACGPCPCNMDLLRGQWISFFKYLKDVECPISTYVWMLHRIGEDGRTVLGYNAHMKLMGAEYGKHRKVLVVMSHIVSLLLIKKLKIKIKIKKK
jgi:hypothetical protein